MEYRISKLKDFILIKVIGPFNRNAVYSVSTFLKPFLSGTSTNIYLDIDNLEDEKDMIFRVGLINAFKKEIDQSGGIMTLKANDASFRKYLIKTRMGRMFGITC